MIRLIVATRNAHKVREIQEILGPSLRCEAMTDFPGAPELVEAGATFAENASAKARQLADWLAADASRLNQVADIPETYVLADDSGLEVDALGGAPGVHSARFAALDTTRPQNAPDLENNAKLIRLLQDVPPERRSARFRCVLALIRLWDASGLKAEAELFEGTCEGRIAPAPSGCGGFGYDPLFIPNGYQRSFGELDESAKNKISHRAKALAELQQRFLMNPRPERRGK